MMSSKLIIRHKIVLSTIPPPLSHQGSVEIFENLPQNSLQTTLINWHDLEII